MTIPCPADCGNPKRGTRPRTIPVRRHPSSGWLVAAGTDPVGEAGPGGEADRSTAAVSALASAGWVVAVAPAGGPGSISPVGPVPLFCGAGAGATWVPLPPGGCRPVPELAGPPVPVAAPGAAGRCRRPRGSPGRVARAARSRRPTGGSRSARRAGGCARSRGGGSSSRRRGPAWTATPRAGRSPRAAAAPTRRPAGWPGVWACSVTRRALASASATMRAAWASDSALVSSTNFWASRRVRCRVSSGDGRLGRAHGLGLGARGPSPAGRCARPPGGAAHRSGAAAPAGPRPRRRPSRGTRRHRPGDIP